MTETDEPFNWHAWIAWIAWSILVLAAAVALAGITTVIFLLPPHEISDSQYQFISIQAGLDPDVDKVIATAMGDNKIDAYEYQDIYAATGEARTRREIREHAEMLAKIRRKVTPQLEQEP